jgi:hypothetical protein
VDQSLAYVPSTLCPCPLSGVFDISVQGRGQAL